MWVWLGTWEYRVYTFSILTTMNNIWTLKHLFYCNCKDCNNDRQLVGSYVFVQQTINSIWGLKCGSVRRSGEWMEALLYQWKTVSLYHNINTPRLLNTSSYIRKQLNHFQLSVFEIKALSSDLRNALWQNQGVFLWKFNEFVFFFYSLQLGLVTVCQ